MALDGINKADFTLSVQLSVRKVLALEFMVHYHYVTISDISRRLSVSRSLLNGAVYFKVAIRTTPARAATVTTSVIALKNNPQPGGNSLSSKLNKQLANDGNEIQITSVVAVTLPVQTSGMPPPTHVTDHGISASNVVTTTTTTSSLLALPADRLTTTSAGEHWPPVDWAGSMGYKLSIFLVLMRIAPYVGLLEDFRA